MNFKTQLAKLIDVKTIITFATVGALTYGFLARYVPVEVYAPLATSVLVYYFNKPSKKEEKPEE